MTDFADKENFMNKKGFTPLEILKFTRKIKFLTGFTVIEMITVIAIIVILAGFIAAASMKAKEKGYVAKAKATIASLEVAISMYHTDTGQYPPTGNSNLVSELNGPSSTAGWDGPYMDIQGTTLKDPWGNDYVYNNPGAVHGTIDHTRYVDIYSFGPNGTGETDDSKWIKNW